MSLIENYFTYAKELSDYSKLCFDRELIRAAGGNISVRLPENQGFMMTPTGESLRCIPPENMVVVNAKGEKIAGAESFRPSKEYNLHLCLYDRYPEVQAVFHVHPAYTTAYACKMDHLPMVTSQAKIKLGRIPMVPYATPGTMELVNNIIKVLDSADTDLNALILQDHGLLTVGTSLLDAFNTADLVEETAQVSFIHHLIG